MKSESLMYNIEISSIQIKIYSEITLRSTKNQNPKLNLKNGLEKVLERETLMRGFLPSPLFPSFSFFFLKNKIKIEYI